MIGRLLKQDNILQILFLLESSNKITYFPSEKLRIEDLNVYELHFGMLMNDVVAMLGTPDAQLVRGLERYRVHQYTRYSFLSIMMTLTQLIRSIFMDWKILCFR
jgi:hypothetical protein